MKYDRTIGEAMAPAYAKLVALAATIGRAPSVPDRRIDPRRLWPTRGPALERLFILARDLDLP